VLVCAPYVIVPAVMLLLSAPAWAWWWYESGGVVSRIPDGLFIEMTLIASAISVLVWFVGRRMTWWLVRRRRGRLEAYLSDPTSA
jgi:hypothetical protein